MKTRFRHLRRLFFIMSLWLWAEHLTWQAKPGLFFLRAAEAALQPPGDDLESADSPAARKFREMAQPEAKKKAKADLERPPFEFLRGQIAPFDVLPYYKQNHWMMMTVEARSSREDFKGSIRTQPLSLFGSQREINFGRPVNMDRNTPTRMSFPLFVPPRYMPQKLGKVFDLDLYREGGLRPTEIWQTNVRAMEPHQMVVMILAKDPASYNIWNKMMATISGGLSRDVTTLERGKYYRFVLPETPDKPLLAPSFLFWTSISHLVWDGFDPNLLDIDQQRAMLDWLHWGGQLTIIGGADSRLGVLRESFLSPYLPADTGGASKQLDTTALKPLAEAFRPPYRPTDTLTEEDLEVLAFETKRTSRPEWNLAEGKPSLYYDSPLPIITQAKAPIYVTGLRPLPGASVIPLGSDTQTTLGVEWRVGRGRVAILAINPTEPSLSRWRGMDTFVRQLILRRPEEVRPPPRNLGAGEARPPMLTSVDLTWLRIGARDTGGPYILAPGQKEQVYSPLTGTTSGLEEDVFPDEEVATWIDEAILPKTARETLEVASGIKIPDISFVAKSLLIYLVMLVPVNWLIFRKLGRKEWAWIANPVMALIFALAIERIAAYDLGFDRGRDEIGLLELQSDYTRGHLTRFGALAATGRDKFQIAFPNDLNAVCLPLAYSASRADERENSSFDFMPVPLLSDFRVQPRSLSYYRSEQMIGLPGPIQLINSDGKQMIRNQTRFRLHDATVVGPGKIQFQIGDLGAGESKELKSASELELKSSTSRSELTGKLNPEIFRRILIENEFKCDADVDSWRLVAWSDSLIDGIQVTPSPDRVRGFTMVLAHLKSGPGPDMTTPRYDLANNRFQAPVAPKPEVIHSPVGPGIPRGGPISAYRGGIMIGPAPESVPKKQNSPVHKP